MRTTAGDSVSAGYICLKIILCGSQRWYMSVVHFCLGVCVHKRCMDMAHRKNIQCLCICVWDVGLGYSAVQIAEARV